MKVLVPSTLDDALRTLAAEGEGARPLAGATDAMVRVKDGQWHVPLWIDIRRVTPLDRVSEENGVIRIGAAVPYGRLLRSAIAAPLLLAAIRDIGSVQIRAMGTIGGNLGTASPAGDTIPALNALDAEVGLVSLTGGERWVPVEQFFLGPGRTVRKPDELILGVKFAPQAPGERWSWQKLGLRGAQAISIVSLALRVRPVRIAFGAVGPTVLRARKCEAMLGAGAALRDVARMAWKEVAPISDVRASAEYRQEMACALLERALGEVGYA
jgi:CO/xanthine dehydrogenase FAD-binding subunit